MINLREYKIGLRTKAKEYRAGLSKTEKAALDDAIFNNCMRLRQYQKCSTLFIYVSTPIEVDTRRIIKNALESGKKVAVPRCIDGKYEMQFHYINSLDELRPGSFSVDEPPESLLVAEYDGDGFMIVPALMLDRGGYRLGYGKGYYDRYLDNFCGQTVGLCYNYGFINRINHGRFDKPVNTVVTEKGIYSVK